MTLALDSLNIWELGGLAATLVATAQNGVLTALTHEGPLTLEAIAARTHADAASLERVLAVLVAAGVCRHDGARVGLAEHVRDSLQSGPGGIAGNIHLWSGTPAFLAHGARVAAMDGSADDRAGAYEDAVAGLAKLFASAAEALADRLPRGPAGFGRVLDVGAGSGVWSLALAARDRDAHVTAFDLPPVLARFRERAAALGLADRASTHAGDFHALDVPPASFDTVVLANVLHLEAADGAEALLARSLATLRPGGRVVIADMMGSPDPARAFAYAVYALHLSMRTAHGRAHPEAELRAWLAALDCTDVRAIDLHDHFHGLSALVATRASGDRALTPSR